MMLQTLRILATAFVCIGVVACQSILLGGPADDRGEFTGTIVAVQPGTVVTRVLINVEEPERSATGYDRVYLGVAKDTEILVPRTDGTLAAGAVGDLIVGSRVRAQHTGVEIRTIPPQYPVARVEILSR